MNTQTLTRWAGLSAMVAGISFSVLGLLHPPNILSAVTTDRWLIVHYLAIGMSLFGLAGVTGIYIRQARAAGWLGLIGFLLMSFWFTLILPFTFIEVFLLPQLATTAPGFVGSFLETFSGPPADPSFAMVASLWSLSDVVFLLGGLTFGIATLRAGVLSRWAAGLLTLGFVSAPVFGFLPPEVEPFVAVPIGLGLVWLGLSLWSDRGLKAAPRASDLAMAQFRQTGAQ
jgi:hypothetical protein